MLTPASQVSAYAPQGSVRQPLAMTTRSVQPVEDHVVTACKRVTRFDAAALGFLLLAGLASGCGGGAAAEEEKTPPAPVKWETARLVLLEEWTELLGTTQSLPDHAARITAPIEGRVASVLRDANGKTLHEGQHVEAGTVVAQLDDRVVRANLDRAAASQNALQEELAQAKSAREVAGIDVDRLTKLQAAGQSQGGGGGFPLVSPVDVQKTRLSLVDAESKQRATEARLKAGAADVAALQLQLRLHQLTAPRKGRLGRILVVPGQTLSVGSIVAEVVDLEEELDILCYVSPSIARKLRVGQTARLGGFDTPAPPGGDAEGKVVFIADQAEPETTGFAVKVRFPNQAHLGANVSLTIRVLTQPGKECLAIPESALMEDQDPPGVIIAEDVKTEKVKGDNGQEKEQQVGKARQLQAIIGIRDRVLHQVEIIRLEDKDKKWKGSVQDALFVVEKQQGLQTGDPIKLQEEED